MQNMSDQNISDQNMFNYIKDALTELAPQGGVAGIAIFAQIAMRKIINSAREHSGAGANLDEAKTINGVAEMHLAAMTAAWALIRDYMRYKASNSRIAKVCYLTSMMINASILLGSSISSLANIDTEYLGDNNIATWLAPGCVAMTTLTQIPSSMFHTSSSALKSRRGQLQGQERSLPALESQKGQLQGQEQYKYNLMEDDENDIQLQQNERVVPTIASR